ncbi:primase-helicase family protein [Halobacteriovorax sp. DA5]|uniref:primase-helicase family protein n=1 Tax=Halobacteriovorax sp. DA5 TaxID=2067553 RepID=UPI000CD12CD7|nr:primase-helicase family protein [Halobacteriovorax sp. DA5]POB13869.1 hypothetical protein C0Z22_07355 [Halobacteriovorax sp. DA5]
MKAISTFPAMKSADGKMVSISNFDDLKQIITTKQWSHGQFANDHRSKSNFLSTDFIVLDFDEGMTLADAIKEFQDFNCLIGTTQSHQVPKNGNPSCDRFRVVLELSQRIHDAEIYENLYEEFLNRYPQADHLAKDAAKTWRPCKEIIYENENGELIEVDLAKLATPSAKVLNSSKEMSVDLSKIRPTIETSKFLLSGAPDGEWHGALLKAASECARLGLSKEDFSEQIKDKGSYGYLDNNDLRTIDDAYSNNQPSPKHPRLQPRDPFQWITIANSENAKKVIQYFEEDDYFKNYDLVNLNHLLSSKKRAQYMLKNHTDAEFIYNPFTWKKRLTHTNYGSTFNTYLPPFWKKEVIPTQSKLPLIYEEFFKHLVSNDTDSYEYLLDWLSRSLTDRNQTMLVAVGEQGIGKGILGQIIQELHGPTNYSLLGGDRCLTGNFNSKLKDKTLLHFDELRVSGLKSEDQLKLLINSQFECEEKYENAKTVDNWASIYISSNTLDAIPLGEKERRYSFIMMTDIPLRNASFCRDVGKYATELTKSDNIRELAFFLINRTPASKNNVPFRSQWLDHLRSETYNGWEEWFIEEYIPANTHKGMRFEIDKDFKSKIKEQFPNMRGVPGRDKFKDLADRSPGIFRVVKCKKSNKRYIEVLKGKDLNQKLEDDVNDLDQVYSIPH